MAFDARLQDLNNRVTYTDAFRKKKKLNFDELFDAPPTVDVYPWNPSRYSQADLLKKMMARKISLNPGLNYVGDAEQIEVFAGLPNFNRVDEYDFQNGRALTSGRPEDQPDYNPLWADSYRLSPTIPAEKKVSNPMPCATNPDPRGNLMASAIKKADNEQSGKMSIAQLMANKPMGSTGAPLSSTGKTETKPEESTTTPGSNNKA